MKSLYVSLLYLLTGYAGFCAVWFMPVKFNLKLIAAYCAGLLACFIITRLVYFNLKSLIITCLITYVIMFFIDIWPGGPVNGSLEWGYRQ